MSIADKLTYLQTTKQLLKTEINKINNVLDDNSTFRSYPQELFNGYLDILNNGTDTLWNNLEKVSQADITEAELSNVVTAPMKIDLKGNTSQEADPTPDDPKDIHVVKGENVVSVSGKNLFDQSTKIDYPINLGDIELCKINTYKDFLFKAINGNEYYDTLTDEQKNVLNYGSWYKHKEIQKYVITGQEKWIKSANHFFKADSLFFYSKFVTGYGLCNQYVYNPTQSGLYASSSNNQFFLQYDRSYCHLFIRNDNYNDVTSWVSYLQSISNSILIYYPLATPTETEITNTTLIEQLEAISNAKSVKGKTYITQTNDELPFILDVEAIKEYEVN